MKSVFLRFLAWIIVIGLVFGGYHFITWLMTPNPDLSINCDFTEFNELVSIEDVGISGYNTKFNKTNSPDVIIDLPEKEHKTYKENKDYWYSPMVLYSGNFVLEEDSGFIIGNLDDQKSYRNASKNLKPILEAIENDKTWKDVGVNSKELKDKKVKLIIPDEYSKLHNYVKELFFVNLGGYDNMPEEDFIILMNRVSKIIHKCEKVEDINTYLTNAVENKKTSFVAVASEYVMNDNYAFSTDNSAYLTPIYPQKTISVRYSIYTKQDLSRELEEKLLDKYNSDKIKDKTNFRTVYNTDNDYLDRAYRVVDNVNTKNISTETSERIKNFVSTETYEEIVEETTKETTPEKEKTEEKSDGLSGLEIFLIVLSSILGIGLIAAIWYILYWEL